MTQYSTLNIQHSALQTLPIKILVVCSLNSGKIAPFITDQVEMLKKEDMVCDYFTIVGKGMFGYLRNRSKMIRKINDFQPDIIHAHYGLSGLLANLQRKIPVITTYHGSDINHVKAFWFSKLAMELSAWNIFVSEKNIVRSGLKTKFSLIPCGVDIGLFKPVEKIVVREKLKFKQNEKLVLFAGSFSNKVKNPELAINAVKQLNDVKLIELKGYSRDQVAQLMNAVDVCLMTSFSEGSPQFIKEAMACNCPVVSVNVGDVAEVIGLTNGCYICSYDEKEIASCLHTVLSENLRSNGKERIIQKKLSSVDVTNNLLILYSKIRKS